MPLEPINKTVDYNRTNEDFRFLKYANKNKLLKFF